MPIMSVLILVLNLYARSATESQIIILDLILSFIPIHRGLLVHNLFQNYNFVNLFGFNTQQCVTMCFELRIGCAVDALCSPVLRGLWCSGCIGLL